MPAPSRDRLLLLLSVEMAAASDALTAAEAFGQFLRARFPSSHVTHRDFDGSGVMGDHGTGLFRSEGSALHFHLPTPTPVQFSVEPAAASDLPAEEEIGFLRQIVSAFRTRHEQILELKGLTYTDDLTGLFNQRYLELILDRELSLAKRNNTQFSVLFLDLDHFKAVNDAHGHLIGSRLLFEVGQEIKRALRESDLSFRYGGDEFVMILAGTDLEAALLVAERVRAAVEKKRFLARENMDIRLTASIGVASVPLHAVTKQQILKAADEALYGTKKTVRNSVTAAAGRAED